MTDNELKEDVKTKLRMYKPYTKRINQLMLEIEEIETRMLGTQGSFPKIPDSSHFPNIHKNSPLWEEIYEKEKEISVHSITIDQVNNFLLKLDEKERDIIQRLFLDVPPTTFTELCVEFDRSRKGLSYIVEEIIIENWEY